jgi:hypothetical protein
MEEIKISYWGFKMTKKVFYYYYAIGFIAIILFTFYFLDHPLDPSYFPFWANNIYIISPILLVYTTIEAQFFWNKFTNKQLEIIENLKVKLEEKNRQILDSIEYAHRIQTAILPSQKIVKQYLENSFIFYKPKDIVAGDFYWMEIVDDWVLFAACDCTGHGVPGAMISVVCHNALNRAKRVWFNTASCNS